MNLRLFKINTINIVILVSLSVLLIILIYSRSVSTSEAQMLSKHFERILYYIEQDKVEEARIFAGKNFFLKIEGIINIVQSDKKTLDQYDLFMLKITLQDIQNRYSDNSPRFNFIQEYSTSPNLVETIKTVLVMLNKMDISELNNINDADSGEFSIPYTLYIEYSLLKLIEEKRIDSVKRKLYIFTLR